MPSLKEFRNRIVSVKSTQKITKALQMVATAKLKRAQEAAQSARPYATRMRRSAAKSLLSGTRVPFRFRFRELGAAPAMAVRSLRPPATMSSRLAIGH